MYLLAIYFLLLTTFSYGVDPVVEVVVSPQSIGTNEVAEIRVNIINEKAQEPPSLSATSDNFDITYRGFISQRQFSIVNGVAESRTINTYSYQLKPKKSGNFTIPAFVILTKNGNQIYSKSSKISIQDISRTRPQQSGGLGFNNPFSRFFGTQIDAFIQLQIDQVEITQNTGILVDLYLYSNDPNFLSTSSEIQIAQQHQFTGGTIYSVPIEDNNDIITEQFGFTTYYGKILQRYIVFPLDTGKLIFYPPVLFSQNLQKTIAGEGLELYSTPITKTLSYIGDDLILDYTLSSSNIKVSDELTLTLTIEGDGNVDFYTDPLKTISISNIFITEPETHLELEYGDDDLSSILSMKKTFIYQIIAKEEGEVTLPEIKLNFHTKNAKETNTILPSIKFNIQKSAQIKSENLSPIKTNKTTYKFHSGLALTIITLLLGISMMLGSHIYAKRQQYLSANPLYAKSLGAKNRLKKLLLESEHSIKNQQYKEAARLIRQSILYFCTDKFKLDNSVSPQDIINYLTKNNISLNSQQKFLKLMQTLDFHAFGSTPTEIQITNYLQDAYSILEELDSIK